MYFPGAAKAGSEFGQRLIKPHENKPGVVFVVSFMMLAGGFWCWRAGSPKAPPSKTAPAAVQGDVIANALAGTAVEVPAAAAPIKENPAADFLYWLGVILMVMGCVGTLRGTLLLFGGDFSQIAT